MMLDRATTPSDGSKRTKRDADDTLKSLAKIVRILECFSVNDRALSLAEIGRRTGLPKSTAHRFAATMREVGFLDQDKERDRYRLGLRLLEFGNIVLANLDVHREARPMVEALQRLTGQAVHLAVFDGMRAVVIHRADAASENAIASALIENAPVHCTSVGKAILAFQPEETAERVIASGLTRYTDHTIVQPDALRAALSEIREQGYAIDDGEHQPGLRCVGAPIRNQAGRVFAGISISCPSWQLHLSEIPDMAKIVMHHAATISQRLGWHG